jgi:2-polyprenyl-6-hydroxyphenyl methylase/3-demethylubiquinone-9 3-methyltransferase
MARKGAIALGIDLATKPLRVAQLHAMEAGTENVSYQEIAVEALAEQRPGEFDTVTCMEMLEHVPDPASVVRALGQLVKPGGWVFLSTLNRNFKAFMLAIVGAEYLLKMLPAGTHEYARFIKPAELAQMCRDAGLEMHSAKGLGYNPLTQRYSIGGDTDVNYMIACRRPL